jgi:outer membrane lipoprotein-sorting protein
MKNYFRLGFAALALVLFFNAFAVTETKAQGAIDQILKRMDEHYKALQTLKSDVKMVKYDSVLKTEDVYEGRTMYLPRKGRDAYVRIDWAKPASEVLSSYEGRYTIFRPRLNQCIEGKTNTVRGGDGRAPGALAFMNMTRAQLKANYTLRYLGEEKVGGIPTWHLELTPKKPQSYKSADLWVDGNGMPIQARVVEKNDDTTTVYLSNLQKNATINASLFKVDMPNNIKCAS